MTGDKCDMCEANYWNFPDDSSPGCESCECMVEGSLGNRCGSRSSYQCYLVIVSCDSDYRLYFQAEL